MPDSETTWAAGPTVPDLRAGDVHVWRVRAAGAETLRELESILSPEERDRASRFSTPDLRERYVLGRGAMRRILGTYLGAGAGEVGLVNGEKGKPGLAADSDNAINFNLSHSGDCILFAVAKGQHVGIDVERIRPVRDLMKLTERFFSPRERLAIHDMTEEEREAGFFACWTRKEAYLKCRALGLTVKLDAFSVPVCKAAHAEYLGPVSHAESGTWTLFNLIPDPDHAAALAVEGKAERIECWEWRG